MKATNGRFRLPAPDVVFRPGIIELFVAFDLRLVDFHLHDADRHL